MPRPALIVTLLTTVLAVGAGPVLPPDSDPMLAVRANAALASDPALKGLPLTVDVLNRVAVVGGPVPDLALVPKIEAVLAKVPGLLAVKVSGWVAAPVDPLLKRVGDKLRKPAAVKALPELPPLALAPSIAPAPPLVAVRPTPAVAPPVVALRPAAPLPEAVTVTRYGPADPPTSAREPGWLDPPTPARPVAPGMGDVSGEVARLVRSDPRFRRLRAEAAGGVVTVTGRVRASGDTFDFVALARKLPGVARVVVGRVAVD